MASPLPRAQLVHVEVGCGSAVETPTDLDTPHVGIDLDLDALHQSVEAAAGWAFVCADARMLPFRAAGCSSVRLRAVLHHLVPTDLTIAEMARSLVRGGTLTIVDGVALPSGEAQRLNQDLVAAGLPIEPLTGFDLDELQAALNQAGFHVEGLCIDGTATLATPPYVSRYYRSDRFVLTAVRK